MRKNIVLLKDVKELIVQLNGKRDESDRAKDQLKTLAKASRKYTINTTGDCVVGDEVLFWRAKFEGSCKNPKFIGYEQIEGKIISESYGLAKQQHTFTLTTINSPKLMIKGRNLYSVAVFRKAWQDEELRKVELVKKHMRGDRAREKRAIRIGFNG